MGGGGVGGVEAAVRELRRDRAAAKVAGRSANRLAAAAFVAELPRGVSKWHAKRGVSAAEHEAAREKLMAELKSLREELERCRGEIRTYQAGMQTCREKLEEREGAVAAHKGAPRQTGGDHRAADGAYRLGRQTALEKEGTA